MTRHKVMAVLAGPLITLAAGMPLAAAAPAGWRVQSEIGSCSAIDSGGEIDAITTTGPGNAWAAGQCGFVGPGGSSALIAHWDGTSWRLLHPLADSLDASAVASLSGSYAWAFAQRLFDSPIGLQDFALQWQNGRWRSFRLADGSAINSAVAFSRSNAWGFGFDGGAYAVRFNGHSWRRVPIPVGTLAATAPGPDNIWAVGPPSRTAGARFPTSYTLAHWTGRWRVIPFPPLNLPAGTYLQGAWVALGGSGSLFVAFDTVGSAHAGGMLLRWNGHDWRDITLPIQVYHLGPIAPDGQGGLWVSANPVVLANPSFDVVMLHRSAAGDWSRTVLPVQDVALTTMRLIPGTTSVWAGGFVASDCNPDDCDTPVIVHGP